MKALKDAKCGRGIHDSYLPANLFYVMQETAGRVLGLLQKYTFRSINLIVVIQDHKLIIVERIIHLSIQS